MNFQQLLRYISARMGGLSMTSHWFDGTKRQTVDAGIRREKDERVASHIDCISRIVIFGSDRHPSVWLHQNFRQIFQTSFWNWNTLERQQCDS